MLLIDLAEGEAVGAVAKLVEKDEEDEVRVESEGGNPPAAEADSQPVNDDAESVDKDEEKVDSDDQ